MTTPMRRAIYRTTGLYRLRRNYLNICMGLDNTDKFMFFVQCNKYSNQITDNIFCTICRWKHSSRTSALDEDRLTNKQKVWRDVLNVAEI